MTDQNAYLFRTSFARRSHSSDSGSGDDESDSEMDEEMEHNYAEMTEAPAIPEQSAPMPMQVAEPTKELKTAMALNIAPVIKEEDVIEQEIEAVDNEGDVAMPVL